MSISEEIMAYKDQIVEWRRDIHAHPELGFQEIRTSKMVQETLRAIGDLEIITDFCPARTAVIAVLRTGRPGHVVGVRADMDALPMQDEKNVDYRSQVSGVCHACGHDGHTAVLLATAKYCVAHKDKLYGTIKFVFQPAEEGPVPGGAKYIMDSGLLDDVDYMIGGHQSTYASVGQLLVKAGVACAGGDVFEVKLTGVGTHAISPHEGADVITTASQIINSWQHIFTRQVDPQKPIVMTVCSLHAGEEGATNVMPSTATFTGTIRSFKDDIRKKCLERMRERAEAIAKLNGCTCEMKVEHQFPILENDPAVTEVVRQAAEEVSGYGNVFIVPEPSMGSEDFAQYAQKIPSSYFMFGVRNDVKGIVYGGHHPKFDMDEEGLLYGMGVFLGALNTLLPPGELN